VKEPLAGRTGERVVAFEFGEDGHRYSEARFVMRLRHVESLAITPDLVSAGCGRIDLEEP
jgi:hypothetical protein